MGPKREVPSQLKAVLDWDVQITNSFVKHVDQNYGPLSQWKSHFKFLEISCHGIPWLLFVSIFIFLIERLRWLTVNIFFALILDIVVVATIKAIARRRRPEKNENDALATFGPDKFSFPSGHCTRATMIAVVFIIQCSLGIPLTILLLSWSLSVSVSRVLLQRHHILDVLAGFIIGAIQAVFINYLWLSEDNCQHVANFFLDETQAGANYDV